MQKIFRIFRTQPQTRSQLHRTRHEYFVLLRRLQIGTVCSRYVRVQPTEIERQVDRMTRPRFDDQGSPDFTDELSRTTFLASPTNDTVERPSGLPGAISRATGNAAVGSQYARDGGKGVSQLSMCSSFRGFLGWGDSRRAVGVDRTRSPPIGWASQNIRQTFGVISW